jgi:hypothetical protein
MLEINHSHNILKMEKRRIRTYLLSVLLICAYFQLAAQNDAALNIEANDQGILVPRVGLTGTDDVSTIAGASTSLLIYNTATVGDVSPGYYYWDGTNWIRFATSQGSGGHYVGELYGGGIVFAVYANGQHGLIASLDDLDNGSGAEWGLYGIDVPNCESMTDGMTNTMSIIAAGGALTEAAGLCDTFSAGGFTDWYLPANRELYLLASQDVIIDLILDNDGDPSTNGFSQEDQTDPYGNYWSSTESLDNESWSYNFGEGKSSFFSNKFLAQKVRAIRAF